MPDGGKLMLRTSNVQAEECGSLKRDVESPYVLVEVEDTGHGIPPEVRAKIFEPFFTTKDVGKGTGLGLSTVYGIVKQTGGFIYADSQPGRTSFRIFLPRHVPGADEVLAQIPAGEAPAIAGALAAADSLARAAAADLTGQGTILLVEDEEGLRALNARGLISRGYTVLKPATALRRLRPRKHGDVDLSSRRVMPEKDAARELRQRSRGIIFVSGYAEEAFSKNLPSQEQYAFLAKPFTLKQLVAEVKKTLVQ